MNARTFECFKIHTQQSKDKKQRVLRLFKLRAENLQRTAFMEGFKLYHRNIKLKKNLNLVASIFQAQRIYKDTIRQFKAYTSLKRKAKETSFKHNFILCIQTMHEWMVLARQTRKLRKFNHKQSVRTKYTSF